MRANLTLMFITYLLAVFGWRRVSKAREIQKAIHKACLGAISQWYTLLLIGCAAMVGWTLHEFFHSYFGVGNLQVLDNLERAYKGNGQKYGAGASSLEDFQEHLFMPAAIQWFSMLSNLAGVLVVVIASVHIWAKFAYPGMRIVQAMDHLDASQTPWWPAPRMNRLVTLMIMPVMLCVMSMRGICRIWALTTGQADNHFQVTFEHVEKWEMALYHMDQQVGEMFQFFGVYAFTRICGSFLNESLGEMSSKYNMTGSQHDLVNSAKELKRLVRSAGFLAVWAFIVVGILRCFLEFLTAESHYYEVMEDGVELVEHSALKSTSVVFSFLTVLCVLNMFIVGRTKTIKDRLGNANMKFMGARLLLLVIAVQEQAAQLLTADSEVHRKVVARAAAHGLDISSVHLTVLQADLLHLSLLNFECLFVVVFNVIVWRDLDLERTGVAHYGYSSPHEQESEFDDEVDEEAPAAAGEIKMPTLLGSVGRFQRREREGISLLLGGIGSSGK